MTRLSRIALALAFMLVSVFTLPAQLHRVLVDGQWGFINVDGDVVVEPQFDYAFPFQNGFTVVRQGEASDGKRAFLNANGELITGFAFDRAYHFVNGFGIARVDFRWAFVRPDGSTLGSFRYDRIRQFEPGPAGDLDARYAGVRMDGSTGSMWGVIDGQGREVLPIAYERLVYAGEGLWWVGRARGEWALWSPGSPAPDSFPYTWRDEFTDGYAVVPFADGEEELWHVLDANGQVVFESKNRIDSFSEGIAVVRGAGGRSYVRADGSRLTDQPFYSARAFSGGAAPASVGSNWGNQRWGVLGSDGRWRMPARYSRLGDFNDDGIARYQIGDLFGFVDINGRELTPPQWDSTGEFSDGLVPVSRDGLWGYVNTSGEIVVQPQYDYAWDFQNGYGIVRYGDRENGQRLYLDTNGRPLSEDRFDWAYAFENGLAHIATGDFQTGEFGYIGTDGSVVWEPSN
jgi:hypothetical protein